MSIIRSTTKYAALAVFSVKPALAKAAQGIKNSAAHAKAEALAGTTEAKARRIAAVLTDDEGSS